MVFRGRLVDMFLELMSAQICVSYFFRITLDTVIADEPSTSEKKSGYHHKLESHRLPGRGKVT